MAATRRRRLAVNTTTGRRLSVAAAFAAGAVPTGAIAAGAAVGADGPTIARDDHGQAVVRVQHALGVVADGIYGPRTANAVKRFQRRGGLKPDNVVGSRTWAALHGRASTNAGGRGGDIGRLQRAVGISDDGSFGAKTKRAVVRFQKRHKLHTDGVVGPSTWKALGVAGDQPLLKQPPRHGHRGHAGRRASRRRPRRPRKLRVVARVIAAANHIAHKPYRYGGGHGTFRDSGYDCSGSISYALHGAGLLKTPRDSTGFESYGRSGRGRHITIYANSGHAFMVVDGRRFDTSGRSRSGSRWGGGSRGTGGFVARHPAGL